MPGSMPDTTPSSHLFNKHPLINFVALNIGSHYTMNLILFVLDTSTKLTACLTQAYY